jgi:hypothetical protein
MSSIALEMIEQEREMHLGYMREALSMVPPILSSLNPN